jgi:hypothetical protein
MSISWDGGKADQQTLAELKARYEAGLDLSELKYEDIDDGKSERSVPDRV